MTADEPLPISGIQHFCFCRRQWALIHVENQWIENGLTAEGRVMHTRVHDPDAACLRDGILTIRGLRIKSEKLNISGVCDAVEFLPDPDGFVLANREGTWKVRPVEYKHGSSKTNDCDRLQLTAQVLCLEETFGCAIPDAYLFYMQTRHREKVEISEELREKTKSMFAEMQQYMDRHHTPVVKLTKACTSCSLADICLPEIMKKRKSVSAYMQAYFQEELP